MPGMFFENITCRKSSLDDFIKCLINITGKKSFIIKSLKTQRQKVCILSPFNFAIIRYLVKKVRAFGYLLTSMRTINKGGREVGS